MMRGISESGLPNEAREEVSHLVEYVKERLGEGVDKRVLSAATTAVALALADTCRLEH